VSEIDPSTGYPQLPAAERVQCLHPDPTKTAPSLDKHLYEVTRAAILDAVPVRGEGLLSASLRGEVEKRTSSATWEHASVGWYTTVVKLDLEARGLLQRAATEGLQRLYQRSVVQVPELDGAVPRGLDRSE
jgi:hypothetical protein